MFEGRVSLDIPSKDHKAALTVGAAVVGTTWQSRGVRRVVNRMV